MNSKMRTTLLRELTAIGPVAEEKATGADEHHDGSMARHRAEQFDRDRSRPWKLGWLDADEMHSAG